MKIWTNDESVDVARDVLVTVALFVPAVVSLMFLDVFFGGRFDWSPDDRD